MKAIIVGGGIGGLTTALMLHARGIDCEIYEQSGRDSRARRRHQHAAARDQGAGELGLLARLDAVGIRTYELIYMNRFGQEIWREPRGTDAGYEYPQFSIHRGQLQRVIIRRCGRGSAKSRIHPGHRLGA